MSGRDVPANGTDGEIAGRGGRAKKTRREVVDACRSVSDGDGAMSGSKRRARRQIVPLASTSARSTVEAEWSAERASRSCGAKFRDETARQCQRTDCSVRGTTVRVSGPGCRASGTGEGVNGTIFVSADHSFLPADRASVPAERFPCQLTARSCQRSACQCQRNDFHGA
jgi:hypothetical protein